LENRKFYANVKNPFLQFLLGCPLVALLVMWLFQGLLYMDPTERYFKIGIDIFCGSLLALFLLFYLPLPIAFGLGAVIAHTLNFLLNAHLWGGLKNYGFVRTEFNSFQTYLDRLRTKAALEPSIERVFVYGSLVRADWTERSDIDSRLLRKPGVYNGVRACWFVMKERTWANARKFPLDIYVIDHISRLADMRNDERPLSLK